MDIEQSFQKAQILRDNEDIQEAVAGYERTRTEALTAGNRHLAAESQHMIGVAFYQAGELAQAEEQLIAAEQEFTEIGEQDFVGMVLRDRGLVALKEDDYDRAKGLVQQSIDTLRETQHKGHLGMSMVKLGVILGQEGKIKDAEEQIREGIRVIEGTQDMFFLSTAWFDLAKLQQDALEHDAARVSAERSFELLNRVGPEDQFKKRRAELAAFLQNDTDSSPGSE